jgi:hypothetical protein
MTGQKMMRENPLFPIKTYDLHDLIGKKATYFHLPLSTITEKQQLVKRNIERKFIF